METVAYFLHTTGFYPQFSCHITDICSWQGTTATATTRASPRSFVLNLYHAPPQDESTTSEDRKSFERRSPRSRTVPYPLDIWMKSRRTCVGSRQGSVQVTVPFDISSDFELLMWLGWNFAWPLGRVCSAMLNSFGPGFKSIAKAWARLMISPARHIPDYVGPFDSTISPTILPGGITALDTGMSSLPDLALLLRGRLRNIRTTRRRRSTPSAIKRNILNSHSGTCLSQHLRLQLH